MNIAAEQETEVILNQAVATITGTFTNKGLMVNGDRVRTYLQSKFLKWKHYNHMPLEYEAKFRVWPKTNRDGSLYNLTIIGLEPESEESVFAGRVARITKKKVSVYINPETAKQKPFFVTLHHDGSVKVCNGWAMQFTCEFEDGKFHVVKVRSLKKYLPKKDHELIDNEPQDELPSSNEPQLTPEQQTAKENAATLLEHARTSSNPRMQNQFKALAQKVLEDAGVTAA